MLKTNNSFPIFIFVLFLSLSAFAQEQFVVYFNSDKFELTNVENKKLEEWMSLHTSDKIVAINGYTDEDGSNGYNDTLAKKRVNYIFDIIKDKVPFRDDFKSRSYGENFNQSKNKAANRKVTIFYIEEKDLARENEILGIKSKDSIGKDIDTVRLAIIEPSEKKESLEDKFAKASIGSKIRIDNINFYLNEKRIMKESLPLLIELRDVLIKYPKLIIEIQGHVCCNPNPNDKISIKLSQKRAKVIAQFLIRNGIKKNRIAHKGFGSNQPLYKIPEKYYKEEVANRRVEIMIVDN
jgi:outer membrane protein OmpA-like peptidoglycan-associated protein